MNSTRGRAGPLAIVGAVCGMVAALVAPHLGGVTAGPVDTDPVETTVPAEPAGGPDTTTVEVTVEPVPTSPAVETSTPTTLGDTDTTEAVVVDTTESVVVDTTEPEPTGPFPTIAPAPKPDPTATETTQPGGAVGPAGPGDMYGVDVVAACVEGTTPVVDFTSTSTADILVTVGGEPNWTTVLAPGENAQGTWPTTERGPDSEAKWTAQSVDPDGWFLEGRPLTLPANCPPPPNTPSAPLDFSTTAGPGSVALTWSPPSWDGESPITDYVIQYNPYPIEDDGWTTVDDGLSDTTFGYNIGPLENCVTYLFRVRADNANGSGEWIDGKDTPALTPCAPPAPSATNLNGQILLEWGEPPSGSSPVTDYLIEYDAHPVDGTWTTVDDGENTNTSFIVGGLTLGTRYSFRVTATSAAGYGYPSAVVDAVPQVLPTAPRSLTAAPTNRSGEIRLAWVAPVSDGGAAITDYVIYRVQSGGSTWETINDGINANTSFVVTGLTNGTRYYFIVRARTDVGDSVNSNTATSIPLTVPAAPRVLTAAATGVAGQVRLSWYAPISNGGPAITDYLIQRSPNGASGWTWVYDGVSTATSYTVPGLATGTRYYFRVYAKNAVGWSPASNVPTAVPTNVLTVPRSLTATPTNRSGQIRLSWLAPLSNGGSAITDYVLLRSPNGSTGWTVIADGVNVNTAYTLTGLTNGVRYYFRVYARTARATSRWSNTATAIPRKVPTAVRSLAAVPSNGSGQVRLTWLAPASNGGSAITDYLIQRSSNGLSWTSISDGVSTATTFWVNGLTNGTRYYFRVFARNAAGWSPASTVVSAIPRTVPSPPNFVRVDAFDWGFVLEWGTPASTGGSPITGFLIQTYDFDTARWFNLLTARPTTRILEIDDPGEGCGAFRIASINAIGRSAFLGPVVDCWP